MFAIGNCSRRAPRFALAVLTLLLAGSANRNAHAVVAIEHFSYALGPIAGMNGGSGWAGPWGYIGGGANVVNPGLTCTGAPPPPPAGRALGPSVYQQRAIPSQSSRFLATPSFGVTGDVVTIRCTMRSSQTGVQGARATLSDPTSGFAIGKFPNAEIGAENWGLQNDQGRVYSTKPVIAGQPVILYAQIDFLNGNDRMQLWVLPCPVTILPPTADIDIMNTNLSGFAEVVWQTDGLDVQLDELRIVP